MDKHSLLKIKVELENALYNYTKRDLTREDIEDIRNELNNVINSFIVENDIK